MSSIKLLCGLPGSGKSTLIKHFKDAYIICPDEIRFDVLQVQFDASKEEFVWRASKLIYKKILNVAKKHNIDIVIDCTNLNIQHRNKWTLFALEFKIPVDCYIFNIPIDVCFERNENRKMVVPKDVIKKMSNNFQPPTYSEGFRNIYLVDKKHSIKRFLWAKSLNELLIN